MKERKGEEKKGGMSLACPFLHSWLAPLGHDGGDRCRCYPLEVILQVGWRSVLGGFPLLEISVVWTRWGGNWRCLDLVRGREWRGREGFVPCVWVLGESDGKKEKKKEKMWFIGRKRIHMGMITVSLTWCSGNGSHKKYKFLSDEKLKTVCQTYRV